VGAAAAAYFIARTRARTPPRCPTRLAARRRSCRKWGFSSSRRKAAQEAQVGGFAGGSE